MYNFIHKLSDFSIIIIIMCETLIGEINYWDNIE